MYSYSLCKTYLFVLLRCRQLEEVDEVLYDLHDEIEVTKEQLFCDVDELKILIKYLLLSFNHLNSFYYLFQNLH